MSKTQYSEQGLLSKSQPCLLRTSAKLGGDFSNFHFPLTVFLYVSHTLLPLPPHSSLFPTMAQVAASRSIQSTPLCPTSGSANDRVRNLLKSPSFASKVFSSNRKRSYLGFRSLQISARKSAHSEVIPVSTEDDPKMEEHFQHLRGVQSFGDNSFGMWSKPTFRRKTKIVCTIGPSTDTREMIWKLAEAGMNVARLNMSHGDHASHQKVIDLVKEYNAQSKDNVIAIMLDTKGPEVRSGDLPQPITLMPGQEFTFTIKRGVGTADCVSVNYDDFVNDVEVADMILVDGGMMSMVVKSKTEDSVKCEVVDGGELKSRRHLNVRGKSATLPSITEKDWDDIKFGVDNKVDFYAVSFVKDAEVVHELKNYLKSCGADIHVIVKIESADSIPNLHSIITASDGAMVARGDLGAELPIEEVPLLQEEIINLCRSMGKAVIVATNMLESMIVHPTPTRAEVSDIAIAVREGSDGIMLSGETAHGKFPLKAVKVMHTVALRTEATIQSSQLPPNIGQVFKNHMSEMFAYHATMMSNTPGTSTVVFTRTGFMAILLSHYRPSGTIFAFTDEKRVQQRLALYQGVCPVYMEFCNDSEATFRRALDLLQEQGMVKEGEEIALVQSGRQPIWRFQSTHNIQVRKV
ncbi:Plastidial pyruvate kinase 2, partial [Mucuna pruriens]